MILAELFDKASDFKVTRQENHRFETEARINGRVITVEIEEYAGDAWEVVFRETKEIVSWRGKDTYKTFKMTGSGGEREVLRMVIDSIKKFVELYHPYSLKFDADKDAGKGENREARVGVYQKLIDRFNLPGYNRNELKSKLGSTFILTKQ